MILHFRFVQLIACGKNIRNINMYFFKLKDCITVSHYRLTIQFNFAFLKQLTKTQHVLFFG